MSRKFIFNLCHRIGVLVLWMRRRFTPLGLITLGGWAIAGNLGLAPGSTQMYQVFSLLSVLFLIAWISHLSFRQQFSVERRLPRWVTAGQTLYYPVFITNLSKTPAVGLTLLEDQTDQLPHSGSLSADTEQAETSREFFKRTGTLELWFKLTHQNRKVFVKEGAVPALEPGKQVEARLEVMTLKRGYHRFGTLYLARHDPFGLLRSLKAFRQEQSLLVLPKVYSIKPLPLPGGRHYQPKGETLASHVGESEEFVSLRDYRPGDPLRDIHWRSWARSGQPVVKQYQEEFLSRQALILDTFTGQEESAAFEEAVSVAASFVNNIDLQDSLLDLMFIGTEAYCFTSGRSLGSVERMLEILASVQPSPKLFETLTFQVQERIELMSGCICVFLSWDKQRQNLVRFLRSRNVPVIVVIVQEEKPAAPFEPGPMQDDPSQFHTVTVGEIQEGLNKL